MTLPEALEGRNSLAAALEFSLTLAKHNPFVRMTKEEQKLANIASDRTLRARSAGPMLSKAANTEELQDLMKREDMIARRSL